jgi:hypothetical protein
LHLYSSASNRTPMAIMCNPTILQLLHLTSVSGISFLQTFAEVQGE